MRVRSSTFLLCLTLLGVLLTSCRSDVQPPLPQGEQTITGVLKSASLSATRRGTHVITQDGVDVYYAESALVHLSSYTGKRVTLRGTLEHNVDVSFLPVLTVKSVVDVEETTKEVSIGELSVRFSAPVHWKTAVSAGRHEFRADTDLDTDEAILAVWEEQGASVPEGGVPIVVDASRAVRLIDELSGAQIVAVKRENSVVFFKFSPAKRINADILREDFVALLSTVELRSGSASSSVRSGSGTVPGGPCGGPAGILCPSGSYCDLTDLQENIGRCKSL